MSEFLEDLEISSVYLALALNKDDLSSSVRDNRTSNETLTQKQMFSEAKIILSHRVNLVGCVVEKFVCTLFRKLNRWEEGGRNSIE